MKDLNFNTTKFLIKDFELFHNNINPKKLKRFAVGKACIEATDSMKKRIKERDQIVDKTFALDVNTEESAIRKNIKKGFLTQQNLHSIICLFFHKFDPGDKFYQPYSATRVKNFLKSLELSNNEPGSVMSFRDFFGKLDIPQSYSSDFEIQIDENWNFELPIHQEVADYPPMDIYEEDQPIPSNIKTENQTAKSLKSRIISNARFFINLLKRNYLIIIGYVFSSISFIVLPIAIIGIYKEYHSDSERKIFKKQTAPYWGMIILFLIFSVLAIIVLMNFTDNRSNDNFQNSNAFDVRFNGNGFVSVHNLTKKGSPFDVGMENKIFAEPNDTIIVSITMSNITQGDINDAKFSLTPRISGSSNNHKFIGTLSAVGYYPVSDEAFVYSDMNTTLRKIDKTVLQYCEKPSRQVFVNDEFSPLIFSSGLSISRINKNIENAVILNVYYVVENFSNDDIALFDNNPAKNGLGFFSINYCSPYCENKLKEITIPELYGEEKFKFYTFVNYRNKGSVNILNAKIRLIFDDITAQNELRIRAELFGENVAPIFDAVVVKFNGQKRYNIESKKGRFYNDHEKNNPNKCKGYRRDEEVDVSNIREKGVLIGKLDTYMEGWCDEGYFIMEFVIEEVKPL